MFWEIILPIFRSTRLCVTACNARTHDVAGRRPATSWVHYTTSCNTLSSAPEDERNNRPKHVELIGIINKPLLLHLVGCLYYLYQWCTIKQMSDMNKYLVFSAFDYGPFTILVTDRASVLWFTLFISPVNLHDQRWLAVHLLRSISIISDFRTFPKFHTIRQILKSNGLI